MSSPFSGKGGQTQRLLLIGFGGLLLLLALTGFYTLSILGKIQTNNESIRLDYVNRDRILENLRSDIYLSGTYVRDLLLEPDPERAEARRTEVYAAEARVDSSIAAYKKIVRDEERPPFERFEREVTAYFDAFHPVLLWSSEQRKQQGYAFMQDSLLPRRIEIVRLADQIGRLNQQQMGAGNARVVELFSNFRKALTALLIVTLLVGLVLAAASVYRILKLERLSQQRFDEVLEARKALRDLSARLLEVQEAERRALSRELHDEVGQALSALLIALGNAAATIPASESSELHAQLLDTRRLAERTVAVVRDMCLFLRPSMLDDLGLLPALEWQAREVSRTSAVRVSVDAEGSFDHLADDQKTCIYRVVQEALQNVVRHARAKSSQIELSQRNGNLYLSIKDDGRGFRPDREKGLGLLGMGERVKHLNGEFAIKSEPGIGTAITVSLPLSWAGAGKDSEWPQ